MMELYKSLTINELCLKVTDGAHFSPSEEEMGTYPMYSSKDMLYNGFDDKDVKMISKTDYDRLVKQDCRPLTDDVLIIKDGNNYLKQIFKVKSTLDAVILSSIAILRPNKEIVNPDYFTYVLRTESVRKSMANYVSGAAIPRVVLKDFKKMKLRLHKDIHIQFRIASILSSYDNLIENNNRKIRLLEQMAENLYKEWFVRFRFPGHEKAEFENGLPKGWKYENLFDIADVSYGYAFKSDLFCNDESLNAVVRIRDIQDNHTDTYTSEACDDKYLIEENAILVGMDGLFHMCLWNGEKAYLNQRVVKINSKLDNMCNYLLFMAIRPQIKFWEQVIAGTTVAHLGDKHLRKVKVAIPNNKLLDKANSLFQKIMGEKNQLFKKNTLLSRQRDLLLPRLMSGKLEVKSVSL